MATAVLWQEPVVMKLEVKTEWNLAQYPLLFLS